MQIIPGTIIDDRYEVLAVLGSGGMGTVYKAQQADLNRIVAVKILHLSLAQNEVSRQRFLRELKILSTLEHPRLVQLLAAGFYAEQLPYMSMEYLQGRTLAEELEIRGAIPWQEAFAIGCQVCEGMEYVHAKKFAHRDLKPQNIFLTPVDAGIAVKILDFGLARAMGKVNGLTTITGTGEIVGTVHYLSPEQCLGKAADEGADIYALGCILYECICGAAPFQGEQAMQVIQSHVHKEVQFPQELLKILPAGLSNVIEKALQKEPEKRYESMKDFRDTLKQALDGNTVRIELDRPFAQKRRSKYALYCFFVFMALVGLLTTYKFTVGYRSRDSMNVGNDPEVLLAGLETDPSSRKQPGTVLLAACRGILLKISAASPSTESERNLLSLMDQYAVYFLRSDEETRRKVLDILRPGLERRPSSTYAGALLRIFISKLDRRDFISIFESAFGFRQLGRNELAEKQIQTLKTCKEADSRCLHSLLDLYELSTRDCSINEFEQCAREILKEHEKVHMDSTHSWTGSEKSAYLEVLCSISPKRGAFGLSEYCADLSLHEPTCSDSQIRESLKSLAVAYEKSGRFDDAFRIYVKLRDAGRDHANLDSIYLAEDKLAELAPKCGKFHAIDTLPTMSSGFNNVRPGKVPKEQTSLK